MTRLGLMMVLLGLATGCASSGKIVVQDGYRGIAAVPADPGSSGPGVASRSEISAPILPPMEHP